MKAVHENKLFSGLYNAIDETVVWSDMVGNVTVDTTGTKDVPLKSTVNERVKVSVCLTAKADGTKLKAFKVLSVKQQH